MISRFCGPAGLFAGYLLALSGYRPLILERGRAVKDRVADVRRFDRKGALDPESNYLFGEGGAGTFSDGKLTSRSIGPDVTRVLEILAECHGKRFDRLRTPAASGIEPPSVVVRTLRRKFESLGGEIKLLLPCRGRRNRRRPPGGPQHVVGLFPGGARHPRDRPQRPRYLRHFAPPGRADRAKAVSARRTDRAAPGNRSIACATVHSAGHPASARPNTRLGAAGSRDLFTFCMCAGGYVMPSVSEPGYFCTNGMSESRHDSPFANSGLVVTIEPSETGSSHPLAGVHYQQRDRAPRIPRRRAARMKHPSSGLVTSSPTGKAVAKLPTSYRRGGKALDLGMFLPHWSSKHSLKAYPGWTAASAASSSATPRSPAPNRAAARQSASCATPRRRESPGIAGLYPCGEGAGYAGGIVTRPSTVCAPLAPSSLVTRPCVDVSTPSKQPRSGAKKDGSRLTCFAPPRRMNC